MSLKKMISDKKVLRYLLSTLLLTVGVYFAYPVRGLVATFPLGFLFSFLAFLVSSRLSVHLVTACAIAFFYSLMTDFYNPFFFGAYAVIFALLGAFAVKREKKAEEEQRKKKLSAPIRFVLYFVAGTVLTFVFSGTPSGFLSARKEASNYLARTYPEQSFEEITVYYNLRRTSYAAEVEYLYEGNPLTSTVFFDDEIEDGFMKDYVFWMQEKRKSVLIDVLKKGAENVLVESKGLSKKPKDGVLHGSYGVVGDEMDSLFHFSVTFRKEKPEREAFAEACKSAMLTLKENSFEFGSVTFYALDAGNVVYECTVSPKTTPQHVLSLVKYAD